MVVGYYNYYGIFLTVYCYSGYFNSHSKIAEKKVVATNEPDLNKNLIRNENLNANVKDGMQT
jgi:hypothetical protein